MQRVHDVPSTLTRVVRSVRARWFLAGAVLGIVFIAIVMPLILLSHRSPWPGEVWLGSRVLDLVSKMSAESRDMSPQLTSDQIELGKFNYSRACTGCHGEKGDGDGTFSKFYFPPPSNLLSVDARRRSNDQLYWATSNGISFTAMPSYGTRMDEEELEYVVHYIRALQDGSAESIPLITPTPRPR
jgi:cytochrome c553